MHSLEAGKLQLTGRQRISQVVEHIILNSYFNTNFVTRFFARTLSGTYTCSLSPVIRNPINMKQYLEFKEENSHKFWSIETNGNSFAVQYGKAGTAGQTQTKTFADDAACLKAAEKLVAEKTKKGYAEVLEAGIATNKQSLTSESVAKKTKKTDTLRAVTDTTTNDQAVNITGQNTTLYFRSAGSDKVYHAEMVAAADGSGYIINTAWGRRGSTMQTACKTVNPLPIEKAQVIYHKLVAEKMSKGYTTGEDGALFVNTENAGRVSGLLPQLLNVIDEATLDRLIDDPAYCAQPKHDGERRMIKESQTGVNRKGLTVALPEHLVATFAQAIHGIANLDGEMEGDRYTAFDLLLLDGRDLRDLPYSERLDLLVKHVTPAGTFAIIETAFTAGEKRALYHRLKTTDQEGIVFKRLDAAYTHGRPNSGGNQLKFKFCASATVFVVTQNPGKRSVLMGLNNEKGTCEVGSVTIPANHAIPDVGQIIEVRYLYAYPQGSLYQPIYAGVRPDMDMADCTVSQLKYKAT